MNIPFVDLKAQYLSIKDDISNAINNILENANFVGGQPVKDFENEYAQYMGVKHCVACGNGTDSIEILLQAMGIGQGDEVIVPAISWISTSGAVSYIGAKPVFVDIDEYFTIDVTKIEEKITKNTKAIIPVHLYGHPADMPKIIEIAKKYNLKILEDCAQAHNATINGQKIGTFGDCASFSFYPGKNLGAYGDAGAMTTNHDDIAEKARRIANHGQLKKHDHAIGGRNSRMDTLQASILKTKLPHLDVWTAKRQQNAKYYDELFINNSKVIAPKVRENASPVYHLYVIRTQNRTQLQEKLAQKGIQTAIHYPTALPFLACYKNRNFTEKDFPVAYQYQNEILSLPMYPELSPENIKFVVEEILK